MLKPGLIFLLLFLSDQSFSQLYTAYFDKEDKKCEQEEAYYIDTYDFSTDSIHYTKTRKTIHNQLISIHQLSGYRPDINEGKCKVYYESTRNLFYAGQYEKNLKKGIWDFYLSNGTPRETILYDVPEETDVEYVILQAYDSAGNAMVVDGEGRYKEELGKNNLLNKENEKTELDGFISGEVKDGYKNGRWTGKRYRSNLSYQEEWEKGKLLSGMTIDSLGQEYLYQKIFVQPEPVNGLEGFYQFIGKNMEYPKKARRMGVEGKVFVQFVVDKNGELIEIIIVKGIGAGCDEQVLEAVQKSPKWKNGLYRGMPVKVRMILPVTFKLG